MSNIIAYRNNHEKHKRIRYKGVGTMCTILEKIKDKSPYELLETCNIDTTPPINLALLLTNIGISTVSKDFSEIEGIAKVKTGSILGAAFSNEDNLTIFYKKSDSFHRKKFTIAHELAHCCLHCASNESQHIEFRIEPFDTELSKEDLEKEKEANIFAGQLLIPKSSLMKYYKKLVIPSLSKLSEIFDVSSSVMAARLDYLNLAYYKNCATETFY